ncbi:MAG TPA: hypothetical protein VM689_04045 [Aliidongia sp.]|nr:hypothetical protein [Aliidongia sp.]
MLFWLRLTWINVEPAYADDKACQIEEVVVKNSDLFRSRAAFYREKAVSVECEWNSDVLLSMANMFEHMAQESRDRELVRQYKSAAAAAGVTLVRLHVPARSST